MKMTNNEIIKFLQSKQIPQCGDKEYTADEEYEAYQRAIDALEQQPSDTVSRGAFEQVMWERDVAIGQLKELGYGLGQKVEPCDDAISRKFIKQKLQEHHDFFVNAYGGFSNLSRNDKSRVDEITNCIAMVVNEPPVTPQQKYGECKNCKWWRDSDGVYRRGVGAESKCPINNVSVNHGLGYCYMYEPQESEDKE